jgi:predicted kinase
MECMNGFVLVGGWPGSGKTTLARALASDLGVPYLSKDDVKEALMDALGTPSNVEESRALGRAAVFAVLRAAQGCQGAVIDSTWYPYTEPLVRALPGPVVEVRCRVPLEVARERYRNRLRGQRHLDRMRTETELWGSEVAALGIGPLVEVTTTSPVDTGQLATELRASL